MISESAAVDFVADESSQTSTARLTGVLSKVVYGSMLALIVLAVIPYGTAEPWWKAFFCAAIFLTAVGWVIEGAISGPWLAGGRKLLLPVVGLIVFALIQAIPFSGQTIAGLSRPVSRAISADPFSTFFFALQLTALTVLAAMLFRYATTRSRLLTLINLIIGVAVASAIFGILRQTTQHDPGFVFPLLKVDQGYGQFINKNHFAFLMEMGFGLAMGMLLGGAVKRERSPIYLAALLPVWTALVLSNSRGGLFAMLAQVGVTIVLVASIINPANSHEAKPLTRLLQSRLIRLVLLTILVVGVVVGTLWVGGDRLVTKLEEGSQEFTSRDADLRQNARRNEIWRASWNMFADYPIAGVGLNGYWIAIPTYHDASGIQTPQEAHNEYLELAASGGLIGLALGAWFVFVVLREMRRNLRADSRFRRATAFAASIALTGVAVHSLVDFGLHMMGNALVFVALLVIATTSEAIAEKHD